MERNSRSGCHQSASLIVVGTQTGQQGLCAHNSACWCVTRSYFPPALLARAIYTADPLTYRRGNSHSSWSGQWAGAPVCYQLTSTLSMCLSHDHHGTLTNAVHLLKTSAVTIANVYLITSSCFTSDNFSCKLKAIK